MPTNTRDYSPDECREEDGYEWVESDPYTKWDQDWQRQYKEPVPTPVKTVFSTAKSTVNNAKSTWNSLSISLSKSGLASAATAAASEVASQASNAVTKIATTGTSYVNQNVFGKSFPSKEYNSAEEDVLQSFQPPLNAFNYKQDGEEDRPGRSKSHHQPSDRATVRKHRRDHGRGVDDAENPDYGKKLVIKEEAEDARNVRAHAGTAKPSSSRSAVKESGGATFDEAEEKRRRERLWEEWRAKPEREPRRRHQRPQLWVGGNLVETQSTPTRTDHGLKENHEIEGAEKEREDHSDLGDLLIALNYEEHGRSGN
ncbi:hypothetical protein G7Y79_00058g091240 [Physcia stellaris]|nr:hypothetical protein G7Y79_00058g091240 [Physcia stellaris]